MICRNSVIHVNLLESLSAVMDGSDDFSWQEAIRTPKVGTIDGFLALLSHPGYEILIRGVDRDGSFDQWLLNGREWATSDVLDARNSLGLDSKVFALYVLWEAFVDRITKSLRTARLNAAIPPSGGLLAFLGGINKCVVLDYEFTGELPEWRVISVIDRPKSAFDFWGAIDQADIRSRNHLKKILSSGHKLIWHRGIFCHIDRRRDFDVFGPSIDTLIMAEIVHQDVIESDNFRPKTALEVGSGNGLLTAAMAVGCPYLETLVAIDTNPASIACTQRTVATSSAAHPLAANNIYYIIGSFRPDLLSAKFDLVVCNPPYIPLPPLSIMSAKLSYFEAVGGTKLMTDLLRSASTFLSENGKLLLMTSNLCAEELIDSLPADFQIGHPLGQAGFEVLFDVEAVLDTPAWLKYLLERGLVKRDGAYYHTLHPVWIEQKMKP